MDRMTEILCKIDDVLKCPRCDLSLARNNVVIGSGPMDAKILLLGEAPGRNEDKQGKPFVGAAGKVLNGVLEDAGISRDTVYITNAVKCRPPKNRVPKKEEIEACSPYLKKQLEVIAPRFVVLLGKTAAETFLGRKVSMAEEHGKPFLHEGMTVMITYHPAAIIYNRKLKEAIEADFRGIRNSV